MAIKERLKKKRRRPSSLAMFMLSLRERNAATFSLHGKYIFSLLAYYEAFVFPSLSCLPFCSLVVILTSCVMFNNWENVSNDFVVVMSLQSF